MGAAPSGPHFERDGHSVLAHGLHDGLHDVTDCLGRLHERGPCSDIADFFCGAAHVDIDDLCAPLHIKACGLGHHGGVCAGDLHRLWGDLAVVIDASCGFIGGPEQRVGGGHLADGVAGAESFAELAIRPIGHAGHGCDEHTIRQCVRPNR